MTLALTEKGPCFGGLTFKNRGHLRFYVVVVLLFLILGGYVPI